MYREHVRLLWLSLSHFKRDVWTVRLLIKDPTWPREINLQAHLDWWCRTVLSWLCAVGMRCRRRAVRASCVFKETRPSSARRFVSRSEQHDPGQAANGERVTSAGDIPRTTAAPSLLQPDFIESNPERCAYDKPPPFSRSTPLSALSASEGLCSQRSPL